MDPTNCVEQKLKYSKVLGKENPAVLYTKFPDVTKSDTHIRHLNYSSLQGTSTEAQQMHALSQSLAECYYDKNYQPCGWVQALVQRISLPKSSQRGQTANGQINMLSGRDRVSAGACEPLSEDVEQSIKTRMMRTSRSTITRRTMQHDTTTR